MHLAVITLMVATPDLTNSIITISRSKQLVITKLGAVSLRKLARHLSAFHLRGELIDSDAPPTHPGEPAHDRQHQRQPAWLGHFRHVDHELKIARV